MSRTLTGRDVFTGRPICVRVDDGRIVSVGDGPAEESMWLAPGLIDLQVNGYRGDDCNADELDVATLQRLAQRMLATGVTTFVPTLITASEEKIVRNLRVMAAARDADVLLKQMIPYVHVEGPHIAWEDGPRGAHPADQVRPPSVPEFARWQAASGGLVGLVTLSPQDAEAPAYIAALRRGGVHVSVGHTNASAEQIHAAADAGAELSTHLGNGVAGMLARHPNLIWAQLAEDRLTAMLLADGHHLPADTLTVMLRAKTVQRSILVSDLVALAGMPAGVYSTPVGGSVEVSRSGRLGVAGGPYLAGASATLADAVAYVASHTGFGLGDAVLMATANPGRFVGRRAVLDVGAAADLIRFGWQPGAATLAIEQTMLRGEVR